MYRNVVHRLQQTMLTEEVDEGLVLLGRIMDWDPIDLTYASLLETHEGATRWDGKPIIKAPIPKDLPSTVSGCGRIVFRWTTAVCGCGSRLSFVVARGRVSSGFFCFDFVGSEHKEAGWGVMMPSFSVRRN